MPARKKTAKKTTAKKKTSAKKTPAKKTAAKKAPVKKPQKGKVSAEAVNLGHVFALRPRVNTSFPQAVFLKAKLELAEETFQSIEEAARAVADKALADANRKPGKHSIGRP